MTPSDLAVVLSGPIGAGKTTLGRALAWRIGAGFVDGDNYHIEGRSWFGSSLTTSRAILQAALAMTQGGRPVVIAYPMRCINAAFLRGRLGAYGVRCLFIGLAAPWSALAGRSGERVLSASERERAAEMLAQGYGRRSFESLTLDTGTRSVSVCLDELEDGVRRLAGAPC